MLAGDLLEGARSLLGTYLVRDDRAGRRRGRIVEVEAYGGPDDEASHARFGLTDRNRVMFGPAGIAYVYLVYGMHDCLNVVVGPTGSAAAVLIRAIEPLEGVGLMRRDRIARTLARRSGVDPERARATRRRIDALPDTSLTRGPGLVAASLGIDRTWTGTDLCAPGSALRLEPADAPLGPDAVVMSERIGVSYANEPWASMPWRFAIAGHRAVSGRRTAD